MGLEIALGFSATVVRVVFLVLEISASLTTLGSIESQEASLVDVWLHARVAVVAVAAMSSVVVVGAIVLVRAVAQVRLCAFRVVAVHARLRVFLLLLSRCAHDIIVVFILFLFVIVGQATDNSTKDHLVVV